MEELRNIIDEDDIKKLIEKIEEVVPTYKRRIENEVATAL